MTDMLYPHEAQLYDRRFMNCAERHAIVFLKEKRPEIDLLFYRAFISSDEIFRQIVQEKKPKYNFLNHCFAESELNLLGITTHEIRSQHYQEIKPDVDALINKLGFVLIAGSVFYFEHCPEYRLKHLHHLVVLHQVLDAGRFYGIADDNPASVLCQYQYPVKNVADFYENNGDRLVRYFTLDNFNSHEAVRYVKRAFQLYISEYQDSQRFFRDISQYLNDDFEIQEIKLQLLHDAFSLLSGSRTLFAHYLSQYYGVHESLISLSRKLGQDAFVLKSLMVKARITKRLDIPDLTTRARHFQECEQRLLQELKILL